MLSLTRVTPLRPRGRGPGAATAAHTRTPARLSPRRRPLARGDSPYLHPRGTAACGSPPAGTFYARRDGLQVAAIEVLRSRLSCHPGCGVRGLRVAVRVMVMGLAIVCWLIAAMLIGVVASLKARSRWSQMSERARRFVKSEASCRHRSDGVEGDLRGSSPQGVIPSRRLPTPPIRLHPTGIRAPTTPTS